MTQQHTAAMRFVRGASAPAPLADPLTEEEALLVSDTQAAIQRLREALFQHGYEAPGDGPTLSVAVMPADVRALLDALDAADVRINGLLAAIEWVNEACDDERQRPFEQRAALDNLREIVSERGQSVATGGEAD